MIGQIANRTAYPRVRRPEISSISRASDRRERRVDFWQTMGSCRYFSYVLLMLLGLFYQSVIYLQLPYNHLLLICNQLFRLIVQNNEIDEILGRIKYGIQKVKEVGKK